MRLPTFLLAWLWIGISVFGTLERLFAPPATGIEPQQWLQRLLLGVIPLLLWIALLQGHQFVWWVLVLYCGGFAVAGIQTALQGEMAGRLPEAMLYAVSCLLLATDPPVKWVARHWPRTVLSWMGVHRPAKQASPQTPLGKEEQEARAAFQVWWQAKTPDDRQYLWRRLQEQERQWALECMPQEEIDACLRVLR